MSVEHATTIGLASTNLEADVVQLIRAWATSFPVELHNFDRQMKGMRKELLKGNGMSGEGHMMAFGDVPVRLHRAMQFRYGKDWDRDQKLLRIFWQNFEVGKVRRHSDTYKAVDRT